MDCTTKSKPEDRDPPRTAAPTPSAAPRTPAPGFLAHGQAAQRLKLLQTVIAASTTAVLMSQDAAAQALADGSQVLARYTTTSAAPDTSRGQPLAVVATVHFPRATVATVGDALNHLLVRTGYRLVPAEQLDPLAVQALSLPLPESQRTLGPYRVDAMVRVLLGDGWRVQVEPLLRRVSFAPTPATADNPTAAADAPAAPVAAAALTQVRP